MIPVLFTTFNRLAYTKQAFNALKGTCAIIVIDNGSTDGTVEWLKEQTGITQLILNHENRGVAGAMNQFIRLIGTGWAGKVDNDTIVKPQWSDQLLGTALANGLDIVQAKHYVIDEVHPGGWDGLMSRCKKIADRTYESQFVGGSGIIFDIDRIGLLPEDGWVLGGWNRWQLSHPDIRKGFSEHTEVTLLDAHGYGDYEEYYRATGRIRA